MKRQYTTSIFVRYATLVLTAVLLLPGAVFADSAVISVAEGEKITVSSGTLNYSAVFYNGSLVVNGTYTAADCDWVDGEGSVVVSVPDSWNIWNASQGGDWTDGTKWSKGTAPAADQVAVLVASTSDFTVSTEGISTVPSEIQLCGFNGKKATLATGESISLTDCNVVVADGGVLSIPEGSSVTKDNRAGFEVKIGGEFSVAGSFSGTNLSATVAGRLYVSGSFAVTNGTNNLFAFKNGADIDINGGRFHGVGSADVLYFFHDQERDISFSGENADVCLLKISNGNPSGTPLVYHGKEFTLAGNSVLTVVSARFGNRSGDATNTVNILDNTSVELKNSGTLSLGYHTYGENRTVVMNLSTTEPTDIRGGIEVGRGARGVLNVDGGHEMCFAGSYGLSIPMGVHPNQRDWKVNGGGEVNIRNGSIYCRSCSQLSRRMGGFHIGCWADLNLYFQDEALPGVMNVYKDGEARIDDTDGYGEAHFIVGCGPLADGEVNVYGGKVINKSKFNPLVGQWSGKGAVNVYEGGRVYMKETMFVGGSETNDLISFNTKHRTENRMYNGGADFDQYFPLGDTTGEGVIKVEDGTFVVASDAVFSAAGTGSLTIGTNGLFVAKNIRLSSSVDSVDSSANVSTLTVKFGSTSAGHVVCGTVDEETGTATVNGTLTVAEGSKLVVDASKLTEPAGRYIPLVQFATMEGSFAESNIELIKPPVNAGKWSVVRTVRHGVDGYYLDAAGSGFALIVR